MADLFDLSSLESASFNLADWVNLRIERKVAVDEEPRTEGAETSSQSTSELPVDSVVSSTLVQLQLYGSELQERVNKAMSQILTALPRAQRDIVLLQNEVQSMNQTVINLSKDPNKDTHTFSEPSSVLSPAASKDAARDLTAKGSPRAKDYIAKLELLDRAKQRLEHAKELFTQVCVWDRLLRETETMFESRALHRIRHHIQSLQRCADTLVHMPDAEIRAVVVTNTKNNFLTLLLPLLVRCFATRDGHLPASPESKGNTDSPIVDEVSGGLTLSSVITELELVGAGSTVVNCIAGALALPLQHAWKSKGFSHSKHSASYTATVSILSHSDAGTACAIAHGGAVDALGPFTAFADWLPAYFQLVATVLQAAITQLKQAYRDACVQLQENGQEVEEHLIAHRILQFSARFVALCVGGLDFKHHFTLPQSIQTSNPLISSLLEHALLYEGVQYIPRVPEDDDEGVDVAAKEILQLLKNGQLAPTAEDYRRNIPVVMSATDASSLQHAPSLALFQSASETCQQIVAALPLTAPEAIITCAATICEHFAAPFRWLPTQLPAMAQYACSQLFVNHALPPSAPIPQRNNSTLLSVVAPQARPAASPAAITTSGVSLPLSVLLQPNIAVKEIRRVALPRSVFSRGQQILQVCMELLQEITSMALASDMTSLGVDVDGYFDTLKQAYDDFVGRIFACVCELHTTSTTCLLPPQLPTAPVAPKLPGKSVDWMDEEEPAETAASALSVPLSREVVVAALQSQFATTMALIGAHLSRATVVQAARLRSYIRDALHPVSALQSFAPAITLKHDTVHTDLRTFVAMEHLRHNPRKTEVWLRHITEDGDDAIASSPFLNVLHWQYRFTLESMMAPAVLAAKRVHALPVWRSSLPDNDAEDALMFSLHPSRYMVSIVEHIISLAQHFAPTNNPIVTAFDDSSRIAAPTLQLQTNGTFSQGVGVAPLPLLLSVHALQTCNFLLPLADADWNTVLAKIGLKPRESMSLIDFVGLTHSSPRTSAFGLSLKDCKSSGFVESMRPHIESLLEHIHNTDASSWAATNIFGSSSGSDLPPSSSSVVDGSAAAVQAIAEGSLWLHAMVKLITATLMYEYITIPHMDGGGARQLRADYEHLVANVEASALGVQIEPTFTRFVELACLSPREISRVADTKPADLPLVKVVAAMRGAIISA